LIEYSDDAVDERGQFIKLNPRTRYMYQTAAKSGATAQAYRLPYGTGCRKNLVLIELISIGVLPAILERKVKWTGHLLQVGGTIHFYL
jgi:hypothetical protein